MTTDDRKVPTPTPRHDKKEEQVADLPTRDASKDDQVKGGRMTPNTPPDGTR